MPNLLNKLSPKAKVRSLDQCLKHITYCITIYLCIRCYILVSCSQAVIVWWLGRVDTHRIPVILCDKNIYTHGSACLNKRKKKSRTIKVEWKEKREGEREKERERKGGTTCKVNTGCTANILMSLLLISATGNQWLPQMLVINKRADSQPMGPMLNNWFSVMCCSWGSERGLLWILGNLLSKADHRYL